MFKTSFSRPTRYLRGKLTLAYTITTVATLLLVEVVGVGMALWISSLNVPYFALNTLKQEAFQAPPYFVHGSPDRTELTAWLQSADEHLPNKQGPFYFPVPTFLAVVDMHGITLASVGIQRLPVYTPFASQLSAQNRSNLQAVLQDPKGATSRIAAEADGSLVGIVAIVRPGGRTVGALVMKIVPPDNVQLLTQFLELIVLSAVMITALAVVTGLISGYITARGLTNRLKGLWTVVEIWGKGDLSVTMHDTSEDELGETMRQLNRMVAQLQSLLQARQKLAMLEERNRVARELHDSVKQQVFAISMQIGAARFLLGQNDLNAQDTHNVQGADVRLEEADKLAHQAQQELTSLIRELRPVALEGKGLVEALRELTTSWARQTNIVANLHVEGSSILSLTVEEVLFRVAQEALSNVARHSHASLVQVSLKTTDAIVTLTISDNGRGFDPTAQIGSGVGLLSMQERVRAIGGTVRLDGRPDGGMTLIAHCQRFGIGGVTR